MGLYKYYYRPGYGSNELLIEIFSGGEHPNFVEDFLTAIAPLEPHIIKTEDVWVNDEILLEISTLAGNFTLSKDIWDWVFIMGDNNQECLSQINTLLLANKNFEKLEVDFKKYIPHQPGNT
jgi:hypothetical protein